MQNKMKKVAESVIRPFREDFCFFLVLWILCSSNAIHHWLCCGQIIDAVDMGARGAVVCYLITFVYGLLKGTIRQIYKYFFIVLDVINCMTDRVVFASTNENFNRETTSFIFGTNYSEASEFISMYLTAKNVIAILLIFALCVLIGVFRNQITKIAEKCWKWMFVVFCIGTCYVCFNKLPHNGEFEYSRWNSVFVCKVKYFLTYEKAIDFSKYEKTPQIEVRGDMPKNIVVIIGESVSKTHSSLYGYDHETQPCLTQMRDSLLLFKEATSPDITTVNSIRAMLFNPLSKGEQWYEKTSLMTYLKTAGYKTHWISNQASSGLVDNHVANMARLCDTVVFVGSKISGAHHFDYDEILIEETQNIINNKTDKYNCYFIHLLGCHEVFTKRFPPSFTYFHIQDYDVFLSDDKKQILADYDNVLRYDDYVVSSLLKLFSSEEAIAFFGPDHSLDMYETDTNYYGHARLNDEASIAYGRAIPFIVYPTKEYVDNNNAEFELLKSKIDEPFCTEELTQLILDICNIIPLDEVGVK